MRDTSNRNLRPPRSRRALALVLTLAMLLQGSPAASIRALAEEDILPEDEVLVLTAPDEGGQASDAQPADEAPTNEEAPATVPDQALADSDPQPTTLAVELEGMLVMVQVPAGVLPADAELRVTEVTPSAAGVQDRIAQGGEAADEAREDIARYVQAMECVSQGLDQDAGQITAAHAYDICFVLPNGEEVEPSAEVRVTLNATDALELGQEGGDPNNVQVAHVRDNGQVEDVDALVTTDEDGNVSCAEFQASEFSMYVVLGTDSKTQQSKPYEVGDFGWLRFGGAVTETDTLPFSSTDLGAYEKYLTVNVHALKNGADAATATPADWETASYSYLSTWSDSFTVESSALDGTVLQTVYRAAHQGPVTDESDKGQNSFSRTYPAGTYYSVEDADAEPEANTLDIYIDRNQPSTVVRDKNTHYVVRYYHADGTYDEEEGEVQPTGATTATFDAANHVRADEKYSGMSISGGRFALLDGSQPSYDQSTGSGVIRYNATNFEPQVKIDIFYQKLMDEGAGRTVEAPWDAEVRNGKRYYDTSRMGLHTDKYAEPVEGDGRTFKLNLSAWNIDEGIANVGMVLDASGSMVWAATDNLDPIAAALDGTPLSAWAANKRINKNTVLTDAQLADILDTTRTDNSKLSYSGYKYYIEDSYDEKRERNQENGLNSLGEYVPIGYNNGYLDVKYVNASKSIKGWYYVNSTSDNNFASGASGTCKSYIGTTLSSSGGMAPNDGSMIHIQDGGPNGGDSDECNVWFTSAIKNSLSRDESKSYAASRFYIGDDNLLHCIYTYQDKVRISTVYTRATDDEIKYEVLQKAISGFASELNAYSPESQVAMTRFSSNKVMGSTNTADSLMLLNWTSDPQKIAAAMNQTYGNWRDNGGSATTSMKDENGGNPLTLHNYGITGGTHTYTGLLSYMRNLTKDSKAYEPKATNGAESKYLIIFTDGVDNSGDTNRPKAVTYASNLRDAGYTIFTVFLHSENMSDSVMSNARSFLGSLAGTKGSADKDRYTFEASASNSQELVEVFRTIAREIAQPLEQYTVRDYLDPRFDLLDADGTPMTVLRPDGTFATRQVQMADGKLATLGYNPAKEMFYLEWNDQEIPTSARFASLSDDDTSKVQMWSTSLTVRAKEDFIGGNDVLSNGNEAGQNTVYLPERDSKGNLVYDTDGHPKKDSSGPSKDFPYTSVNPQTLTVSLVNYEDTVFLGEGVTPYELYQKVAQGDDSHVTSPVDGTAWYLEYLERFGLRKHGDRDYYADVLQGGAAGTAAPGEAVVATDDAITITLPYYYLDSGVADSYAGGAKHEADQVGTLTYTWTKVTNNHTLENGAFRPFTTDATENNDIRYELRVTYTPAAVGDAASGNDGSARTTALTGSTLIRDAVGSDALARETTDQEGIAVVHVVDGRVHVVKRVPKASFDAALAQARANNLTAFSFTLSGSTGSTTYEDRTVTVPVPASNAGLVSDGDYYVLGDAWAEHLPQGAWVLTEDEAPGFDTTTYAATTYTGADVPTAPYNATSSNFAATGTASASASVSWAIGITPSVSTAFYPTADFAYGTVADATGAYKGVDRTSGPTAKAYLNAQIGEATVTNTPAELPLTNVRVTKTGDNGTAGTTDDVALAGAVFQILADADGAPGAAVAVYATEELTGATVTSVTTDKDGLATFYGLPDGTYWLHEATAPAGYQLASDRKFVIAGGKVTHHNADGSAQEAADIVGGLVSFAVLDTKVPDLPQAGGLPLWLAPLGCALVAAGALTVSALLRRREAEGAPGGGGADTRPTSHAPTHMRR